MSDPRSPGDPATNTHTASRRRGEVPAGQPRVAERSEHRLYAHVCWTTLGRVPILRPSIRALLEGHLIALCRRLDAEPIAVTVLGDRVHLLLRHKPGHALGRLVAALKRGGREALDRVGERVTWGRGFAAASLSSREVRQRVRTLASVAERAERCDQNGRWASPGPGR